MISILCPTRERIDLTKRMIDSAINTASGDIEILLFIDDDDPKKEEYKLLKNCDKYFGNVKSVGVAWNILAKKCKGDILITGNDDLVFRTQNWDTFIKEGVKVFPDNIYIAWANDGSKPKKCTFPIISRDCYNVLGYFMPEVFHFLYHDTWMGDIGVRIGRTLLLKDVIIEHMHPGFKKREPDKTFRRNKTAKIAHEDTKIYNETSDQREKDANKLRLWIQQQR